MPLNYLIIFRLLFQRFGDFSGRLLGLIGHTEPPLQLPAVFCSQLFRSSYILEGNRFVGNENGLIRNQFGVSRNCPCLPMRVFADPFRGPAPKMSYPAIDDSNIACGQKVKRGLRQGKKALTRMIVDSPRNDGDLTVSDHLLLQARKVCWRWTIRRLSIWHPGDWSTIAPKGLKVRIE